MSESVEIVNGGVNPLLVDEQEVGAKGYGLLQLAWWGDICGFITPKCSIVPTSYFNEFLATRGPVPHTKWLGYPSPNAQSPAVARYFKHFYQEHALLLSANSKWHETSALPSIRTSLLVNGNDNLSFAGVNFTFDPRMASGSADYFASATSHALAALYRPYAEWYLNEHQVHTPRSAGIIINEYVEKSASCTALVVGETIILDAFTVKGIDTYREPCHNSCFINGMPFMFHMSSAKVDWPMYWRHNDRGLRVRRALENLVSCARVSSSIEVEFAFDDDDHLYLTQVRSLANVLDRQKRWIDVDTQLASYPLFHTPGRIEGPICNLAHVPKSIRSLSSEIAKCGSNAPIFLVLETNDRSWDAFSLLWAISRYRDFDQIRHWRVIVGHDLLRKRMHLIRAMLELPWLEFVGQTCASSLLSISTGKSVSVESDGVHLSISVT